jgi:hypothetical protein
MELLVVYIVLSLRLLLKEAGVAAPADEAAGPLENCMFMLVGSDDALWRFRITV